MRVEPTTYVEDKQEGTKFGKEECVSFAIELFVQNIILLKYKILHIKFIVLEKGKLLKERKKEMELANRHLSINII